MKHDRPDDRLSRFGQSITDSRAPQVYALRRDDYKWSVSRRGVFGLVAAAAAASRAAAQSCVAIYAHSYPIGALAVTPDGRWLASGDSGEGAIKLWKLPEWAHYKTFSGVHPHGVMGLAVSPDSRSVASAGYDNNIRIWSVPEGALVRTLSGHTGYSRGVAFAPDGRLLASGGFDKTVRLWSLPEGTLVKTLDADVMQVQSVAISPDGELLASGGFDGVKVWSLPEGKLLTTMSQAGLAYALAFAPDGRLFSGSTDNSIRIWAAPEGRQLATLSGLHTDSVQRTAVTADGKLAVSSDGYARVGIWSLPEGKLLTRFFSGSGTVQGLALTPDGRTVASGSGKTVTVNSLPDGNYIAPHCLADLSCIQSSEQAMQYQKGGVTYTLPCGSTLPAAAVCTCNCVPGTGGCSCVSTGGCTSTGGCSCVPVTYYYPN